MEYENYRPFFYPQFPFSACLICGELVHTNQKTAECPSCLWCLGMLWMFDTVDSVATTLLAGNVSPNISIENIPKNIRSDSLSSCCCPSTLG